VHRTTIPEAPEDAHGGLAQRTLGLGAPNHLTREAKDDTPEFLR
jgi:hypothetical protein